jgi:predicted transcriptional regulator
MTVTKARLQELIKELPAKVEVEEIMYRLYLMRKIEAGEEDVRKGRVLSHSKAMKRLSRKWQS